MKTAVSLPNDLFQLAEATARRRRMSRSQLYAVAIADFLARRETGQVTARLDAVYADVPAHLEPALEQAQWKSVEKDSW